MPSKNYVFFQAALGLNKAITFSLLFNLANKAKPSASRLLLLTSGYPPSAELSPLTFILFFFPFFTPHAKVAILSFLAQTAAQGQK